MTIRFDDSLPTLARVIADELGSAGLATGVVLRDSVGRLAFFSADKLESPTVERLSQRLCDTLGPYARTDRVVAGVNDYGAERVLNDPTVLPVTAGEYPLRLVDRRLVGIDWLRAPSPVAAPPPRLVFASIKGGVGRSTALAVTAADLASRGLRVLAIDLDMEAPGLGPMLLDEGTLPEYGVLDALVENGLSGLDEVFLADLIGPSALAGGRGRIDVMPVLGRRSLQNPADVLAKIARAYVEDSDANGDIATIRDQIGSLLGNFSDPMRYDAILVDARAGLHETTASAIMGLGAEVFLFGLDEPQTWQGLQVLLAHLARFADPDGPAPEWLSRLTIVQGKAPANSELCAVFAERCRTLVAATVLGPRHPAGNEPLMRTGPFRDIPWDDEAPDEEVLPDVDWSARDPVAILEDNLFRGFNPLTRRDLLEKRVYHLPFGQLLAQVHDCVLPPDDPVRPSAS